MVIANQIILFSAPQFDGAKTIKRTSLERSVEEYKVSTKPDWLEKKPSAKGYQTSVKHRKVFHLDDLGMRPALFPSPCHLLTWKRAGHSASRHPGKAQFLPSNFAPTLWPSLGAAAGPGAGGEAAGSASPGAPATSIPPAPPAPPREKPRLAAAPLPRPPPTSAGEVRGAGAEPRGAGEGRKRAGAAAGTARVPSRPRRADPAGSRGGQGRPGVPGTWRARPARPSLPPARTHRPVRHYGAAAAARQEAAMPPRL
ncbi:transcription initiation factor TFIID subunit 4-like [Pseudopipra pipra]|uniref:transcription initiation factor TFIID subunit 4-like n=1 Tax=Pseudopipra pipra TaxID=415032 RepID=UPI003138C3D7